MKSVLSLFTALFWAAAALGQGTISIVPGGLANVEGNSSTSDPFTSSSFRLQMVFDASQFAFPPGMSGRVDSIAFRIDGASAGDVIYSFGGSSVTLSTTTRTPDSLSPVFADNVGANPVTIFNGGLGLGSSYFPGQSPQPFNIAALGNSAFYYTPSQGNLLVDIVAGSGQTLFPGFLDAHLGAGDSMSRVFSPFAGAASGTADSLGMATRINFALVPEPSSVLLLLAGLGAFVLLKRR